MAKTTTKVMTLGEFIAEMKSGWGFWRAGRVQRIGEALAKAFDGKPLDVPVEVKFISDTSGDGPNFHYLYDWVVNGIPSPTEGKLPPSTADVMFGYTSGMLPELHKTETGFRVGYVW